MYWPREQAPTTVKEAAIDIGREFIEAADKLLAKRKPEEKSGASRAKSKDS